MAAIMIVWKTREYLVQAGAGRRCPAKSVRVHRARRLIQDANAPNSA